MATFTGTNADETITPNFVSPTVSTSGEIGGGKVSHGSGGIVPL
jgi:hypothetical protein